MHHLFLQHSSLVIALRYIFKDSISNVYIWQLVRSFDSELSQQFLFTLLFNKKLKYNQVVIFIQGYLLGNFLNARQQFYYVRLDYDCSQRLDT